jgi:predicted NAD-dependent protein-ADP-ribosyltransferase YbiA (DUF1768 family)
MSMAQSELDPEIVYPVRRQLETDDKDFDAWVYEAPIGGRLTPIAIGKPRGTFADHGIVHYPIYKVKGDVVAEQIGVYEAREDRIPQLLDDEGAVQPELMGKPILYSRPATAPGASPPAVPAGEEVEADEEASAAIEGAIEEGEAEEGGEEADMETAEEDAVSRQSYRAKRGAPWIQKFMRSGAYGLVDNEAGGDCLFAAIRQGLESVGEVVSVAEMRSKLADAATPGLLEGYEVQYAAAKAQYDAADMATKTLTRDSRRLRGRMKGADRSVQFALVEQAEEVTERLKEEKEQRALANELLEEFKFMEGITTLEALRAVLQTPKYWGDTWAVSTLERVLRVKLIIFSREAFKQGDDANVLLCGQNNDDTLEREGKFEPAYYLLLSLGGTHAGNMHYELISYNQRRAFRFRQLPYQVRHMVLLRCLERQAGPYSLIPDFREALAGVQPAAAEGHVGSASHGATPGKAVFQMYGRSAGGPRPGEGTGEEQGGTDSGAFASLAAIAGWRRLLADDGPPARDIERNKCPDCFELDGKKWATVRHYALAARFSHANPAFAATFAYTPGRGSKLGKDVDLAVRVAGGPTRGRKSRRGEQPAPEADPDADAQEEQAAERARRAKFAPGTKARRALLETGNAELRVFRRGAPARPASALMKLRDELRAQESEARTGGKAA